QNYIGRSRFDADPYLNGAVDDVRIFGRALSASEVTALSAPPAAPAGLTAVPGDSQITLNWNSVAGATHYIVRRASAAGGPYSTVASGLTTPSYRDSGLTNGTTYFYLVVAANALAEGPNSGPVEAKPAQTFLQWRSAAFGA